MNAKKFFLFLIFLIGCAETRAARTAYDFTSPEPENYFVARENDLVRIGLTTSDTRVTLHFPSGAVAWSEQGLPYLVREKSVTLVSDSNSIDVIWAFDPKPAIPISRRWRFEPMGDQPLQYNGVSYRGTIEIFFSRPPEASPSAMTVVNELRLDDYLRGVVPKEIGFVRDDHLEALKAQAVAARTYAIRNLGRRAALGFDLFGTTADQAYGGITAERALTDRAVAETADEILVFRNEPIDAYYHSTCGGVTAARHEAWGGPRVPYLVSRRDILAGEDACSWSKYHRWTTELTNDSLAAILKSPGPVSVEILSRTAGGRVGELSIRNADTEVTAFGDAVRWRLAAPGAPPLRSAHFDILQGPAGITIAGRGWGHGIGMCQIGAISRARAGTAYRDILAFYYPGVHFRTIEFRPKTEIGA